MTWYIIANPTSGGGAVARMWPQLEQLLQSMGFSYTVQFTDYRGHATRLTEDAILRGARYLLGVGGDGTNHEIVNGIMQQTEVPTTDIHYALLPTGTGNDWARMYGIIGDPARRLAQLKTPELVLQDVGVVQYQRDGAARQRYFANVAGLAYDGYIGKKIAEHRVVNRLHYLWLVAKYLFKYQLTPARVTYGDDMAEDHFYTINIGVCKYSGGGMQFVPQAIPDDGLLALSFARRMAKWEVLLQTPRFYSGSLLRHAKVTGTQTETVTVTHMGEVPLLLEADGEYLGETPAYFTLLPKALCLVK